MKSTIQPFRLQSNVWHWSTDKAHRSVWKFQEKTSGWTEEVGSELAGGEGKCIPADMWGRKLQALYFYCSQSVACKLLCGSILEGTVHPSAWSQETSEELSPEKAKSSSNLLGCIQAHKALRLKREFCTHRWREKDKRNVTVIPTLRAMAARHLLIVA